MERADLLVDLILMKENAAYEKFVLTLKTDYLWLYASIKAAHDNPLLSEELDDQDYKATVVLGNFPQLPPYHIDRTSKVSRN